MKKSRYTEEQIAYALKQAETGTPVEEVLRRMGMSVQTFYRWRKDLEKENLRLRRAISDLTLDKLMLHSRSDVVRTLHAGIGETPGSHPVKAAA